jgi:DNA-binding SARP family transcriptional activator
VRLLATVPGIVGLQGELPTKRARRALELIAYLAMQMPNPVTGDRLRTRVLGSADADAAAKTLFNTVGAARRALGVAPNGEPLLPPASRSGHYRLSPLVTVDALRACALVHEGLECHDPTESVARLREALELVKGEPFGGVLTGYAWWQAEGHERRVADSVVDGACALVDAALDSGDLDLARWALAQARKVEPYSESLTRAAMRVAAASGDVRRLHTEWQECQRTMDELDPGGVPSERTERLYALLRSQLNGTVAGTGRENRGQASFAAIEAAPLSSVPSAPSTV